MSAEARFRLDLEARLATALAPVKVYSHPPADMAMPAVTLDRIMTEPDDLLAERQTAMTVTFTSWSRKRGPAELEAIHATMRAAVQDQAYDLAEGAVVRLRWQRDDITRDADGLTYVGSILIQALIEH